ncbi:hypothetical protein CC86DRAFT_390819 [Ophiobolus disseminans]|uniref:Rhodopsin domain-containing protein n=1 Tax=Ophiobolus disseminans TaxID=1469910 RepID=A0A6A7AEI8_9PLEO|nr:hypothetical protein CC86DRAFT_390819 [Ophiobolus disseminans]
MDRITQRADVPVRPDERQGPTILGATLTVTVVALITTIARLYVRLNMIRNVGWDDYVMIATMTLCVVGQCLVVPQVYYGAGRHIEYIDPQDFSRAFKLNFITQPIYLFAICFVKVSFGFFLLRIAVRPFYRRIIISIMTFMGIYTIGCFFTIVLQCTDLRMLWDPNVTGGTCWSGRTLKSLSYTNQALNISTDIAFSIAIPIPMIWTIQMNRRKKASLICILSLGIFATAAAFIKLTYIANYGKTGDWLWDSRNLTIWTIIECNVGIVAGNLPCLKPIFRTVLGSTYGHGSRKPSHPTYISRSYGPGTNHRSVSKNYATLSSNKSANREFRSHSAAGESFMLTTVDASKGIPEGSTRGSSRRKSQAPGKSSSKSSSESVARLHDKIKGYGGLGDITVTTKVDICESVHSRDEYEDKRLHGQPQTKDMV